MLGRGERGRNSAPRLWGGGIYYDRNGRAEAAGAESFPRMGRRTRHRRRGTRSIRGCVTVPANTERRTQTAVPSDSGQHGGSRDGDGWVPPCGPRDDVCARAGCACEAGAEGVRRVWGYIETERTLIRRMGVRGGA